MVFERFSENDTKTLEWMYFASFPPRLKRKLLKTHQRRWGLREVYQTPIGNYAITTITVRHRKRKNRFQLKLQRGSSNLAL